MGFLCEKKSKIWYIMAIKIRLTFPEEKRNLIYIYLESMENTFMDVESGGAFAENLIPNLTKLTIENENFSGNNESVNGAVVASTVDESRLDENWKELSNKEIKDVN